MECTSDADCGATLRCERELGACVETSYTAPTASASQVDLREDDTAVDVVLQANDLDGQPLQWILLSEPQDGTLSGFDATTGHASYTPAPDFFGVDSLAFAVSDGRLASAPAIVLLNVEATSDAPVVPQVTLEVDEDAAGGVDVRATDADGGDVVVEVVAAQHADGPPRVQNGFLLYTPQEDFPRAQEDGVDVVEMIAHDPQGVEADVPFRVNVTVHARNDAPTIVPSVLAARQDITTSFAVRVVDIDDDPAGATLHVTTAPAHGTALVDDATHTLRYTPSLAYFGSDVIGLTVTDVHGSSSTYDLPVAIASAVDVPTATAMSVEGHEDAPLPLQLQAINPTSGAMSFRVVAPPQHGVVVVNASTGAALYTPGADFAGTDSFVFAPVVNGADGTSAVITLLIAGENDPPRLAALEVVTDEDTEAVGTLPAFDLDEGDVLEATIVQEATHGVFVVVGLDWRYTPDADFAGNDTVTLAISDGHAQEVSTLPIRVRAIPDLPVAQAGNASLDEDAFVVLNVQGNTVDGDALSFTVTTTPAHGTLSQLNVDTGSVVYTPHADFHGEDRFEFIARNRAGLASLPATFTLVVRPRNDAPVVRMATAVSADEDQAVDVAIEALDVDGDTLSFELATPPAHGTANIAHDAGATVLTYTPAANFHGTDAWTVRVRDGEAEVLATSSISVRPVADIPEALPGAASGTEDVIVVDSLGGTSIDGDAIAFVVTSQPTHGSVDVVDAATGSFVYTPDRDSNGDDTFEFVVRNTAGLVSPAATERITIAAVNDRPILDVPTAANVPEDGLITVPVGSFDVDGDALDLRISAPPARGIARLVAQAGGGHVLEYAPAANFHGSDVVAITLSDDANAANSTTSTTIALTVTPVADTPRAQPMSTHVTEDAFTVLALRGDSVDGDALSFVITRQPARGALSQFNAAAGTAVYTPAPDSNGVDDFEFLVRNTSNLVSEPARVELIIDAINDAPTLAPAAQVSVLEDSTAMIALHVADVEGDAVQVDVETAPGHGAARIIELTPREFFVEYTPGADFNGDDSVTVVVAGEGPTGIVTTSATIALRVSPVPDAPVIDPVAPQSVNEDGTAIVRLTGHAETPDGQPTEYLLVEPRAEVGSASIVDDQLTYRPALDVSGRSDCVHVIANANGLFSESREICFTITPVNDPPSCLSCPVSISTPEDAPTTVDVAARFADLEHDPVTCRIVTQPANGTAAASGTVLTYTPAADRNGADAFTFACDDTAGATGASNGVVVSVTPVADAPVAEGSALLGDGTTTTAVTTLEDRDVVFVLRGHDVDRDPISFFFKDQFGNFVSSNASLPNGTLERIVELSTDGFSVMRFTPKADVSGDQVITFLVSDGTRASSEQSVTVRIAPVPDPPRIGLASVIAIPTTTTITSFDLQVSDPDIGDAITTVTTLLDPVGDAPVSGKVQQTSVGTITVKQRAAPTTVEFRRTTQFRNASFTIRVVDSTGRSDTKTIQLQTTGQSSCARIRNVETTAAGPALSESNRTGIHLIDPGAPGDNVNEEPRFFAHCDMDSAGGGWTMVMRMSGSSTATGESFEFGDAKWTTPTKRLNKDRPDLDTTAALLPSWNSVPVSEILVGMSTTNRADRLLYVRSEVASVPPIGRPVIPSLASVFAAETPVDIALTTRVGAAESARTRWKSLVPNATLPAAGCDKVQLQAASTPDTNVRIGLLAGCTNGTTTSRAFIGLGGASDKLAPPVFAGARDSSPGGIRSGAFAALWVRDDDFTNLPRLGSCAAHRTAGARLNGRYLVGAIVQATDCVDIAITQSTCRDGLQEDGETCDDGNAIDGDQCDSNCTVPACGNGIVVPPEECDPPDGLGCDVNCTIIGGGG